jgi:cobalt/nickel transport system permease protein
MSTFGWLSQPLASVSARDTIVPGPLSSSVPAPMHIPDGFLSAPVSLILWVVAIIGVGYALRRVNRELDDRKVPLMGVMAAAIFAGQMLNFTVAGGTSGHLVGAALAAIVLGPWAAIVVMACVVGTQALLFQDGGLLALGANVVNMGIIGVAVGYAAYTGLRRLVNGSSRAVFVSGFVSAWLSIVVAALAAALELALSGTSPANVAVPAMGGIHMLIGVGEGLITAGGLALLLAARRDLFSAEAAQAVGSRGLVIGGIAVAVLLAILSPLASAFPDGLEWVAEEHGFLGSAQGAPFEIIPDYVFPGIADERVATIVAGIVGLGLVFGVMLLMRVARRKRESTSAL